MKEELDRLSAERPPRRAGQHYAEIEFTGVTSCDLPESFSHAEFLRSPSVDDTEPGPKNIHVFAESLIDTRREFIIRATTVTVRLGTVYYYKRENLKPDERIASWIK